MNKVLVATDLSSRGDLAMLRGAQLAGLFGCEWVLLNVVDDDGPSTLVEHMLADINNLLQQRAEKLVDIAGQWPRLMVLSGDVGQTIAQVARSLDADLLVVGTHRREGAREVFVGSTSERVIRMSEIPVLRVGNQRLAPERLLLALDESEGSARELDCVRRLKLLERLPTTVVHAFELPLQGPLDEVTGRRRKLREETEEGVRQMLRRFFLKHHVEFEDYQLVIAEGSLLEVLDRLPVELQPQLLAVATNGGQQSGARLGHVALRLLRALDCDLLCVPGSAAPAAPTLS